VPEVDNLQFTTPTLSTITIIAKTQTKLYNKSIYKNPSKKLDKSSGGGGKKNKLINIYE